MKKLLEVCVDSLASARAGPAEPTGWNSAVP